MELPLVSCIMPTYNRRHFIPFAIAYFLKQDYLNLELIIIDDSDQSIIDLIPQSIHIKYHYNADRQSVGLKRNEACQMAGGDIIVHLDDDDWYASDWVTHQVKELMGSGSDICGLNEIIFYDSNFDFYWQCIDTDRVKPWIHGATLVYWKSFWKKHLFKDIQAGEDNDFIWNNHARLHAYRFYDGYLGTVHSDNIAIIPFENPRYKIEVTKWMKPMKQPEDWRDVKVPHLMTTLPLVTCIMPTADRQQFIPSAIQYFLDQDYPNKELVIVDDGVEPILNLIPHLDNVHYFYKAVKENIGSKRNFACEKAAGSKHYCSLG